VPVLTLGSNRLAPGANKIVLGAGAPLPPGVSPDSLPNLSGWYNGDNASSFIKTGGSNVTDWVNKSAVGVNLTQPNTVFQTQTSPGLDGKTALDLNQLGGFNWYRIVAGDPGAPAIFNNLTAITIVTIVKEQILPTSTKHKHVTIRYDSTTKRFYQRVDSSQWLGRLFGGANVDVVHPAAYDGNWHLHVLRWDNVTGVFSYDVDGVKVSQSPANKTFSAFEIYYLGVNTGAGNGFSNALYQEHFFYTDSKSDADVANLRLWLQNKYPSLP